MTDGTQRAEQPEILAPAGDWEALRAAVANGADAVYFGLSDFNARHRATNFTLEELPQVMEFLHQRNVRGYVTCNTLIFSDELPQLKDYVQALSASGADAVIVQDLGLTRLIHRQTPGLPVHGSTQMTLTEPRGVEFVRQLGVERVILARELSRQDIGKITATAKVPVEVFVHGALCVAYSGQCLTSESLGGRSANRGQCAQACRLPYDLIVDGEIRDLGEESYLLSPQDLAAPDLIADLTNLGVACFKIEGRLKSGPYVAAATQTYRAALDAALANREFQLSATAEVDLAQTFSRGFSHGFLSGVDHQELVQGRFPKSRGLNVGTVVGRSRRGLTIELVHNIRTGLHADVSEPVPVSDLLKPGDGVVFDSGHPEQEEPGGRVFVVYELPLETGRRRCEVRFALGAVDPEAVPLGSLVWKTDDPAVRRRLEQSYNRDIMPRRVPLDCTLTGSEGTPLRILFQDDAGRATEVTWEGPLQLATKRPLTEELVREQLGRLGETPYELGRVTFSPRTGDAQTDGLPVMVPKSVLNDLRRKAVEQLRSLPTNAADHGTPHKTQHPQATGDPDPLESLRAQSQAICAAMVAAQNLPAEMQPTLHLLCRDLKQVQAVCEWEPDVPGAARGSLICDFEDIKGYATAVQWGRDAGIPVGLATLRIVKPGEDGWLRQVGNLRPDFILVRNLAALGFYREQFPDIPLVGDYSLNIANELTAGLFLEQGLRRLVPSYDLNWQQLTAFLGRCDPRLFEVVIHQHMPMFHMEHCVFAATLSDGKDYRDCGRPCDRHQVNLQDHKGEAHPLLADVGCRNTVFNANAQSAAEYVPRMLQLGLRNFRVELLRDTPDQIHTMLNRYLRVLAGTEDGRTTWTQLRVLNQLGVTRGTLDFA